MRLIYTVHDPIKARKLASFLISEGIDNRLEMTQNADWGSHEYGNVACNIWIYDEDQLEQALDFAKTFNADPENPCFDKHGIKTEVKPQVIIPGTSNQTPQEGKFRDILNRETKKMRETTQELNFSGNLTMGFLLLCSIIFIICQLTAPSISFYAENLPSTPLTAAETKKDLLYDYPRSYELLDKIIKLYGVEKLQSPQDLPPEGQFILNEYYKTPYWHGFYDVFVNTLRGTENQAFPPMFEKIQEGEVWRLFTPALLHNDILHLVFNMLWLIVLGRQIEQKISGRRYILMILALAGFSNTCQYLMSGANFLGFSGVICGMLTFIWMRQRTAPWEGYPLQRSTFLFMIYFILAMLLIQSFSFFFEIKNGTILSPGIANTAHIAGAALGLLLGRLSFFSWKSNSMARRQK